MKLAMCPVNMRRAVCLVVREILHFVHTVPGLRRFKGQYSSSSLKFYRK